MGIKMKKMYYLQTTFFLFYSFWAGYNYILAHKEIEKAHADTASIIMHMSLKELNQINI